MIRTELRLKNENFANPTLIQLQEEFQNNQTKWVLTANIEQVEGAEKLVLTTKEGYIFYITETKTEYKGKDKVVDTSSLGNKEALKLEVVGDTSNGKLVKITDLSGQNYYEIEYQIDSQDGEWLPIKSGETVEVGYSGTIHARLTYDPNKGTVVSLSIEASNPSITAKNTDTSNLVRKTNTVFSDLFDITWGSDGTGSIEYSISGNLNFKNTNFSSTEITNLSELEIGNYTVTCKIISPSKKEASATKDVKVTKLAPTSVINASNSNVSANAIYSEYDLAYFRDLVNGGQFAINGKVMNDIDLSKVCSETVGNWTPIGEYNSTSSVDGGARNAKIYYDGIFDGMNNKIENLYINDTSLRRQGLFSIAKSNSIIKNVEVFGNIIAANAARSNWWNNTWNNKQLYKQCKYNSDKWIIIRYYKRN